MKHLPAILLTLTAVSLLIVLKSCKKDTPPPAPTEKELLKEQLTKDAAYNSGILPGAGNFFVNADLRPKQKVQQVATLSLSGDSLVLLGSTNQAGKVDVVHTAALFPMDGTLGGVAQVSTDREAVLIAATSGTQRLNPVLSVRWVGASGTEIALREYGIDGVYKTLAGGYYENGDLQAGVLRMETNSAPATDSGCPLPESTDGDYGQLTDVSYVRCMLQRARVDAGSLLSDYIASNGSYRDGVEDMRAATSKLLEALEGLDRLDELRLHERRLGDRYVGLVASYTAESSEVESAVGLKLLPDAPSYIERDGGVLSFKVLAVDSAEGSGLADEPVYAKVRLTDGQVVYFDEVLAIDTGAADIVFDPRKLESYGKAESLTFSYRLVTESSAEEVSIPLHYVMPEKVTIRSGNNQEVKMLQEVPQLLEVAVVAADGLPVEGVKVMWDVIKGGGHFGGSAWLSIEAITDEQGIARTPVKWALGRKGDQEVRATAYYKGNTVSETIFHASVYQPKRELVYFTGLDDHNGVPLKERTPVRVIEDGQRFEAYHNVGYAFRVKEDGEFVHNGGTEILTAFTDGKGPWMQRAGDSFFLEDYEIPYLNGQGYHDTLRIDVVVKNTLYDLVVGRTLKQRFLNGDITYYKFNEGGSVAIYHNNNMQTATKTYMLTIDEPVGQRGNLFANAYTLWFCEDYTYHEPNIGVVYIGAERGKGISDYDLSVGVQRLYVNEDGKLSFNDRLSRSCVDYLLEWAD